MAKMSTSEFGGDMTDLQQVQNNKVETSAESADVSGALTSGHEELGFHVN